MVKDPKRRRGIPFVPNTLKLLLLVLVAFAFIVVFRHGYIPARYSPFATVDLTEPDGWFLDWRIAQLASDNATCRRILRPPHVNATPVSDRGTFPGCGWNNAFRISKVGQVRLSSPLTLECPAATGLAMWMEHTVQPAAKRHFGSRVSLVRHVGGYNCRNIRGGLGKLFALRSEHARANAIDIVGFRLADGRAVSVLRDWSKQKASAGKFLREVHSGACSFFRVTLGPNANKNHRDHFHLDRGPLRSCR